MAKDARAQIDIPCDIQPRRSCTREVLPCDPLEYAEALSRAHLLTA